MTAILFDCFGTLVTFEPDRTALAYPRCHALLGRWGHALTHDEFVGLWHRSSIALEAIARETHVEHSMLDYAAAFSHHLRHQGKPLTAGQQAELATTFLAEWRLGVRPVEGADCLLGDLASSFRVGVLSNTNDPLMVPELLDSYFVGVAFDPVVLSVDHGLRKPHPSIYEAALDLLGCTAAEVAFVGDSYHADFAGPTAAGMTAYLIDPDHQHPVPDDRRLASLLHLRHHLG